MKKIFSNIICLLLLANIGWAQSAASVQSNEILLAAFAENVAVAPAGGTPTEMFFGPVEISALRGINSRSLDFSPMPTDEGMVFTSSRKKTGLTKRTDTFTGMSFTDLYLMEMNKDGKYSKTRPLFGKVNRKYHDGTAVFVGNKMYFTRNNLMGKNSKDLIDLKIYQATKTAGNWVDAAEMPFNSDDFATCHPAISTDGTKMIFSSDRPGGQGGMDLWSIEKTETGWSEPVNMGASVNSAKNEIFPFLDNQGRLFYSSNGHVGMGGLDLFVSQNEGAAWSAPINLGTGMNSQKDDFGIWVSANGNSGYFSSDRFGGRGGDDIYEWKAMTAVPIAPAARPITPAATPQGKEAMVVIIDAISRTPISGAMIDWAELAQGSGFVLAQNKNVTTSDGTLPVTSMPSRNYVFNVAKDGYKTQNVNVSDVEISTKGTYYIPMEKKATVTMSGAVTDAMTGGLVPSADVEMVNLCDNSVEMYRTDGAGKFNFTADCNCSYKMTAKKNGYTLSNKTIEKTCTPSTVRIALATSLVTPAPTRVVTPTNKYGVSEFYEGQMLTLHDVYYDFDKWFIRDDAAVELNHLVSVMNQYPSLKIELGSHTDARGNDEYNRNLSQQRADAAVKYIISKGISSNRITARGYGETMLTNQCGNGVKCSDEEHQANRRTEVRVTSVGGGVNVRDQH